MKHSRTTLIFIVCASCAVASQCNELDQSATPLETNAVPLSRSSVRQDSRDDLAWLVGRWRCITRKYLSENRKYLADPGSPLGPYTEDFLEYFNVYYPYADERLTLLITDNPSDRPIAAEFLVRKVGPAPRFEEKLVPMDPQGPVEIAKDRICVGAGFEIFSFKYKRVKDVFPPRLVLESKHTRLVMEKLSDDAGDIAKSRVVAPLREYSSEQLSKLKAEYEALKRKDGAKSADPL